MPDEALKPLTDAEIDCMEPEAGICEICSGLRTGDFMRLCTQAREANAIRFQLVAYQGQTHHSNCGCEAMEKKLEAVVRLAKAHLDWQESYQIDECGDEDLWLETEKAEALCLSLGMAEALGLGGLTDAPKD